MTARGSNHARSPGASVVTDQPVAIATIERVGQAITVTPPCEAVIGGLTTSLHVAAVHGTQGFKAVAWPIPLYEIQNRPWAREAVMPAGLEPVVQALLERSGIDVVVEPRTVTDLPAPERSPGTSRILDPALLDFIRGRERGLIRVGPGVAPELLVAQVRWSFQDARIAVAAKRREDVRRFGRALKDLIPSTCWSLGDDFPADPGPLVVTTYMGLSDHGVDIHRRDILICLNARDALGRDAGFAIGYADRARLFGLAGLDEHLAPFDLDRLHSLFGFDSIEIPRHGHITRPVEVFTGRIVGTPPTGCTDVVGLKRRGLWNYPIRNRRVARLAACSTGGSDFVAEFPAIAARLRDRVPTVVVLVEGIEHAVALAGSLPGWPILAGAELDADALPRPVARVLDGRQWTVRAEPVRAIATLDGIAQLDLDSVDLVIRADGGVGVPEALAGHLSIPHRVDRPLILVDFDDRHHPELRRRSRGRRRAYRSLGWTVDGVASSTSPLDLFPAARRGTSR